MKNSLIINEEKVLRKKCTNEIKTVYLNLEIDYNAIVVDEKKMVIIIPVNDKSLNCSYELCVQVALELDPQASKLCEMIDFLFFTHKCGIDFLKENSIILKQFKKKLKSKHSNYHMDIKTIVDNHLSNNSVLPYKILGIEYISIYESGGFDKQVFGKSIEEALQKQDKLELFDLYCFKITQLIKEKVISFRD